MQAPSGGRFSCVTEASSETTNEYRIVSHNYCTIPLSAGIFLVLQNTREKFLIMTLWFILCLTFISILRSIDVMHCFDSQPKQHPRIRSKVQLDDIYKPK